MNLKLRSIVPIVLLNNDRKHNIKKSQIKNKVVKNLKQSQSTRQSTGKSNRIKEHIVSPEVFVSKFLLTAIAVMNTISSKIRNKAQAENRNYDFKYKEKSKREIDRLRKLKYQARYPNLEVKPNEAKIRQELEESYKFVADLEMEKFEAEIERKNELEQLELANWVEKLKSEEQKEQHDKKRAEENEAFLQRQILRQYILNNTERMRSYVHCQKKHKQKHVYGELCRRIREYDLTGKSDPKIENLQQMVTQLEREDAKKLANQQYIPDLNHDSGYSKNYPYDPSYDPSWEYDDGYLDCYPESYKEENHEPFSEIDWNQPMIYRFEDCEDFRQCDCFPRCDKFCPKELVSAIVDKSQQSEQTNVAAEDLDAIIDDTEDLDALYDKTHNIRMIINVFNNQKNNGR